MGSHDREVDLQLRTTQGPISSGRLGRSAFSGETLRKARLRRHDPPRLERLLATIDRRRGRAMRRSARARQGAGGLAALALLASIAMKLRSLLGGRSSAGEPAPVQDAPPTTADGPSETAEAKASAPAGATADERPPATS